MVYLLLHPAGVRLDWATGPLVRAAWYNPRNGGTQAIGEFSTATEVTFTPPVDGPDWVLVLDVV